TARALRRARRRRSTRTAPMDASLGSGRARRDASRARGAPPPRRRPADRSPGSRRSSRCRQGHEVDDSTSAITTSNTGVTSRGRCAPARDPAADQRQLHDARPHVVARLTPAPTPTACQPVCAVRRAGRMALDTYTEVTAAASGLPSTMPSGAILNSRTSGLVAAGSRLHDGDGALQSRLIAHELPQDGVVGEVGDAVVGDRRDPEELGCLEAHPETDQGPISPDGLVSGGPRAGSDLSPRCTGCPSIASARRCRTRRWRRRRVPARSRGSRSRRCARPRCS
ncbi:MAG: hypothetical protein QOE11_2440, partial [Solirubrobacteraceae bacterium]|nr:hypothetical protein [Solirubrobacteraceae bacterium]